MGTLKYDGMTVDFDDRLLAHMEVVIVQKLRRQESFLMSWRDSDDFGGGRSGIWLHSGAALTFHLLADEDPRLDRAWLEKLMLSANSPMGMFVTDAEGTAVHPSEVNPHA